GVLDTAGAVVVGVHDREVALATGQVLPAVGVVEAPDLAVALVVLDGPALGGLGAVEGLGDTLHVVGVAGRRAGGAVDRDLEVHDLVTVDRDLLRGGHVPGVLHDGLHRVGGTRRDLHGVLARLGVGVGRQRRA